MERDQLLESPIHRRTFLARTGLLAAGLACSPGLGRFLADEPRFFLSWSEVRPGVFATTDASTGGNCLAVAGTGGALLVDTKYPAFARELARNAEALTGAKIVRVVNTHHHGDHTGGNLDFCRRIPVIAHERAVPRVRAQGDRLMQGLTRAGRQVPRIPEADQARIREDIARFTDKIDDYSPESFVPNTTIADGRTGIDLGGRWVDLVHSGHRAHTDNDVVVRLAAENVLHTGDLVFNGLHPFFDPSGGGTARGWVEALAAVLAMCDAETVVVPGHGPITDAEGVRAQARYIEQLRESVSAEIDKGTALDEIKAMTWPFMEGLGFESVRERAILFVHAELIAERG